MASVTNNYISNVSMTITLASLANGSGRAGTAIDNTSTKAVSADIRVKIKTNATGTLSTGYVLIYLIRSDDGTNYEDSFAGSDAALTPSNPILLGSLLATANATTYQKVFDTAEIGLTLPQKYSVCVVNNSGAALDATGGSHSVTIESKGFTIA